MNHKFITVLFDSGYGISRTRMKLFKEFQLRYPNVICLTNIESVENTIYIPTDIKGFIDYIIINVFLSQNKDNIASLTIIDADITLEDSFFDKITEKLNDINDPCVIQGWTLSNEIFMNKIMVNNTPSIVKNYNESGVFFGHSGYILSFNRKFLDIIDWKFPEYFLLGGFDYFLMSCCLKNYRPLFRDERMVSFYSKLKEVKFDYIEQNILHNYHGSSRCRLTPWNKYESINEDVIKEYWDNRNEV